MATLAYQSVKVAGTTPTTQAASAGGDSVAPNERGCVMVVNGSGAGITVTVVVPGNTRFGQANPDVPVSVGAGATAYIGPFPVELADPVDGLVDLTYSAVTSVTVAALSI